MKVTPTAIPDVLILEPEVYSDERGFFLESFNQREFDEAVGIHVEFVQDNHSRSSKGVLRGLHYQTAPHEQGKLVRVLSGAVFDVAVDLRQSSPTFGRWVGLELRDDWFCSLWLPPGIAHGFLALSEQADLAYKTTTYRVPAAERVLSWDDPDLAVSWPLKGLVPTLSPKDRAGHALESVPKICG